MSRPTQMELLDQYEGKAPAEECTCPGEGCPLRGNCRVCVAWHRDHAKKPLPHCLRDGVRRDRREGVDGQTSKQGP